MAIRNEPENLTGRLTMLNPNFIILYVKQPAVSATFYSILLGRAPAESSPAFVMFALESGVMLGLWSSADVKPASTSPGGSELAITVANKEAANTLHANWREQGIAILQTPTQMDFGYTFVGIDPDGHRLRIFCPTMG